MYLRIMKWLRRKWFYRTIFGGLLVFTIWFIFCLPDTLFEPSYSAVLLDREGQLLSAIVANDGQWRFPEPDSVPYKFKTALLHFEDRHFEDHHGVYLPSLGKAMVENIEAGRVVRGGSTITMQVIRLSRGNPERTYFEKLAEIFRALRLEFRYDKRSILRFYAAHAPMGGNIIGLETASWRYFGRPAHQLSWAESATLAVLPNAPSLLYPGKSVGALKAKRDRLLRSLHQAGHFDSLTLSLSMDEPIPDAPKALPQLALHALEYLRKVHPDLYLFKSTLDFRTQKRAEATVRAHSKRLSANLVENAAAIISETPTGNIAAYVGNSGRDRAGGHVDIIHAPRSPGSTLKPFLYMQMLDDGLLTPQALRRDLPVNLNGFQPENFDNRYRGRVKADIALARSLNVPAVLQLREYGAVPFHRKLQLLGFNQMNEQTSHYGLSLVLGGAEVTLWELHAAYRKMGSVLLDYQRLNARYSNESPTLKLLTTSEQNVEESATEPKFFSAGAAWACIQALQKVVRPESEGGWERTGKNTDIAWKTGTSYGFRDAWASGLNPAYTVTVWTGNADGVGRPGVIGSQSSAPILFELFSMLPPGGRWAEPSDDLREMAVCRYSGMRASRHCTPVDTLLLPANCAESGLCEFHRTVFVTADQQFRTNKTCDPDGQPVSWFVLPAAEAWYYRQFHPEYRTLPPYKPGCGEETPEQIVAIRSPDPTGPRRFELARGLSGEQEPLVVKAALLSGSGKLFWHLDDHYLGSTRTIHEMELYPKPGDHRLIVMDEIGHSALFEFFVVK